MPSFNGVALFGAACKMTTQVNPVSQQRTSYPGISGVETLTLGQRGVITTVKGYVTANTKAALASYRAQWYSYYDGNYYVLVDTYGVAWPNVTLENFQPGNAQQYLGLGFGFPYEAQFFHQTVG